MINSSFPARRAELMADIRARADRLSGGLKGLCCRSLLEFQSLPKNSKIGIICVLTAGAFLSLILLIKNILNKKSELLLQKPAGEIRIESCLDVNGYPKLEQGAFTPVPARKKYDSINQVRIYNINKMILFYGDCLTLDDIILVIKKDEYSSGELFIFMWTLLDQTKQYPQTADKNKKVLEYIFTNELLKQASGYNLFMSFDIDCYIIEVINSIESFRSLLVKPYFEINRTDSFGFSPLAYMVCQFIDAKKCSLKEPEKVEKWSISLNQYREKIRSLIDLGADVTQLVLLKIPTIAKRNCARTAKQLERSKALLFPEIEDREVWRKLDAWIRCGQSGIASEFQKISFLSIFELKCACVARFPQNQWIRIIDLTDDPEIKTQFFP